MLVMKYTKIDEVTKAKHKKSDLLYVSGADQDCWKGGSKFSVAAKAKFSMLYCSAHSECEA